MIEHLDFIGEQSLDQRLFVIQLIKFHNVIIKSDTCNNNNNKFVLKTRDCPFPLTTNCHRSLSICKGSNGT